MEVLLICSRQDPVSEAHADLKQQQQNVYNYLCLEPNYILHINEM